MRVSVREGGKDRGAERAASREAVAVAVWPWPWLWPWPWPWPWPVAVAVAVAVAHTTHGARFPPNT